MVEALHEAAVEVVYAEFPGLGHLDVFAWDLHGPSPSPSSTVTCVPRAEGTTQRSGSTGYGPGIILNPVEEDRQETSLRVLDLRPGRHAGDVATDATDGVDGPGMIPGPSH